jgi:signal transduction histidine kinase
VTTATAAPAAPAVAPARTRRRVYLAGAAGSVVAAYTVFVLVNTQLVGHETRVPGAAWLYLQDGLDIVAASTLVIVAALALDRLLERDQRRLVATLSGLARVATLARRVGGVPGTAEAFRRQVRPIEERTHAQVADLAQTFGEMLTRLEDAVESQRRFLADTSHELRNPLTALSMNLSLLQRDGVAPSLKAEALRDASAEATRMQRLVNDLLLLARGDLAELLHLEVVELEPFLAGVVEEAGHPAGAAPVCLGALAPATVIADPGRLRQVLSNVVDNARRFTPPDGVVSLGLRCYGGHAASSSAGGAADSGWAVITCADTGSGIAPEHVPHVFDRFYQVDPSRSGGGAGLGLAIVKHLVEAHGGRVTLTSTLGAGTTVEIHLPLARTDGAD